MWKKNLSGYNTVCQLIKKWAYFADFNFDITYVGTYCTCILLQVDCFSQIGKYANGNIIPEMSCTFLSTNTAFRKAILKITV